MISAETSALVAGAQAPAARSPAPVTVRLLRAVMVDGQRIEPATDLTVDRWMAADLITAGKAERVATPTLPPSPPDSAAVAKPPAKEKSRAQQ